MNEYYPTPSHLVKEMYHKINKVQRYLTILEPSAGKGHIVKEVQKLSESRNGCKTMTIDAIEVETEFQHILRGENIKVIHDDFLTFETFKSYDCIMMNPPFSCGDKHLMKAIEIQQRRGGQVICILNAETIRNPHSFLRKKIIRTLEEYKAEIDFIEDGFVDAERKTGVEVALISVTFPEIIKTDTSLILDKMKKAEKYEDLVKDYASLISGDPVMGIIDSYEYEIKVGVEFIEEYFRISPVLLSGDEIQNKECFILLSVGKENGRPAFEDDRATTINKFIKRTRHKYWKTIFNLKAITEIVTTDAYYDINSKIEKFSEYDVTLFNIRQLQQQLYQSLSGNIEAGIESFFDDVTTKAYDGKNTLYYDAWKTNKAWKIGKKAIIWLNAYDSWSGQFDPDYKADQKVIEMEKVLSYLSKGKKTVADSGIRQKLRDARDGGQTKNIEFEYFNLTFYKKGTCHIEFTNEKAIELLNIFVAKKRNWLPPAYGKKEYYNLTPDEKEAINNFQGEKNYERCRKDSEVQNVLKDNGFLRLSA
ncbi:DUF4942 domain-containing protein [Acetobacterium sp.]|uniref:class I SAM-dependent methyltransferase n=1 Tax=Acetobacterium sp. TaxID=1872094 RepID=UPI002718C0F5|nr:DUF4942 domain-containing protein [Acetobacterium sp.]MDO9492818.1 DUF4942 domain-containing protein [Acetobacterium sp.]